MMIRKKIRGGRSSYRKKPIKKLHVVFNIDECKVPRERIISLILSSYDDLFSDFDPRPYAQKALSDDFLAECKRASYDKNNNKSLELILLMPKQKRNTQDENTIKKRLLEHFQKHYLEKLKEHQIIKKEGISWTVFGWILLFLSGLIYLQPGIVYQLLFVVFNPAGWFTMWRGFDLFFSKDKDVPDFEFYKKMSTIEILFHNY